jgi:hypothetical protein
MASPTPRDTHLDVYLSDTLLPYRPPELVSPQVWPVVGVPNLNGNIPKAYRTIGYAIPISPALLVKPRKPARLLCPQAGFRFPVPLMVSRSCFRLSSHITPIYPTSFAGVRSSVQIKRPLISNAGWSGNCRLPLVVV